MPASYADRKHPPSGRLETSTPGGSGWRAAQDPGALGRAHAEHARGRWNTQTRVHHHGNRTVHHAPTAAGGELRIVRQHGLRAHQDRVDPGAQGVNELARWSAGNPA